MIHFSSTLKNAGSTAKPPRHIDSLNGTRQKPSSDKILSIVEEELHDARRVHSHGQEEDLKLALNMLIDRLSLISSMLSEAYKTQAELEVQLNVAKSNLQLVIANNDMLEEALKGDSVSQGRGIGWHRAGAREHERRSTSASDSSVKEPYAPASGSADASTTNSPVIAPSTPNTAQETSSSRFFRFRFTGSSPNPSMGTGSRPLTPVGHEIRSPNVHHLNSPSLPVLPIHVSREKEMEEELEKEKEKRKEVEKEKEGLEAELESLSQALFEEANKMVKTERIKRADTEEELRQTVLEKEALRSALKLLETENEKLKGYGKDSSPLKEHSVSTSEQSSLPTDSTISAEFRPHSRAGGRPPSLPLTPLPVLDRNGYGLGSTNASEGVGFEEAGEYEGDKEDDESQVITPQDSKIPRGSRPASLLHLADGLGYRGDVLEEGVELGLGVSPWADVASLSGLRTGREGS